MLCALANAGFGGKSTLWYETNVKPRREPCKDAEIIQAVQKREPYAEIAARFSVSKATVSRIWARFVTRALAQPVAPCGPSAVDPHTGVECEITDDLILGSAMRSLSRDFHRVDLDLSLKLQIANTLPRLALARHRIREQTPTIDSNRGVLYTVLEASPDCPEWQTPHRPVAQVHFLNLSDERTLPTSRE